MEALYARRKEPSRCSSSKRFPAHFLMSPSHPCLEVKSGNPTRSSILITSFSARGALAGKISPQVSPSGNAVHSYFLSLGVSQITAKSQQAFVQLLCDLLRVATGDMIFKTGILLLQNTQLAGEIAYLVGFG